MFKIDSLQNVQLLFAYLLPGFLISFIFSRFFTGRTRSLSESVINYLALTTIYYTITYPISGLLFGQGFDPSSPLTVLLFFIIGPIAFGLLLGAINRRDWFHRILRRLGIAMVHPIPSAWDWRFYEYREGTFVLITMDDGSRIGGRLGPKAFASSDPEERDIYLDEIWDFDEDGEWQPLPKRKGPFSYSPRRFAI